MRLSKAAFFLVLVLVAASAIAAAIPDRAKGISIHMFPKRVADIGSQKWGLEVAFAEYLEPEISKPVLQSTTELLSFVRKQKPAVQENGVWIVTTHPDAYAEPEKKLLEDIKALCRKERIPLFIVRGSQLPNGWQRYDTAP